MDEQNEDVTEDAGAHAGEQQQEDVKELATSTGEQILQFFSYTHLPVVLREVSAPFAKLAVNIVRNLPRNPERTVALRKLLEAKDAAVRARLAQ